MDEKTIPLSKLPVDVKVQTSGKNKLGAELDYRALFEQTGECVFIIGLGFQIHHRQSTGIAIAWL